MFASGVTTMLGYYVSALRRYADVQGRSSRPEIWWFHLAHWLILVPLSVLGLFAFEFMIAALVYDAVTLPPHLGLLARRLHDQNLSAWWLLLIPTGVGFLVLLALAARPGDAGENRYGPALT